MLLVTLIGMDVFGCLDGRCGHKAYDYALTAGTDNRSNKTLLKKSAIGRWSLILVNLQLSQRLMKAKICYSLDGDLGMRMNLQML